jgi:hypothetical protein
MEFSDEELFSIVEEIDGMVTGVTDKDADFIAGLLERGAIVSDKQREWIMDMYKRYLRV